MNRQGQSKLTLQQPKSSITGNETRTTATSISTAPPPPLQVASNWSLAIWAYPTTTDGTSTTHSNRTSSKKGCQLNRSDSSTKLRTTPRKKQSSTQHEPDTSPSSSAPPKQWAPEPMSKHDSAPFTTST